MKKENIIFWFFWGITYAALAICFWKFAPIEQSVKEDMAKITFGITLMFLMVGIMLSGYGEEPTFLSILFFSAIAIGLPFWPIPLAIIWIILKLINKVSSEVLIYRD